MPTGERCAVVVSSGGAGGARQALATLESLADHWRDHPERGVLLVAPSDAAHEDLVRGLDGRVTAIWDVDDVGSLVAALAEDGVDCRVLLAGDAVEPEPGPAPLRVPLVDVMAVDAQGRPGTSFTSTQAADDGAGLVEWVRDVDPSVRQPLVVFTNLSVAQAPAYRAARKVAWLVESPEVLPETAAWVQQHEDVFDLVITSDRARAAAFQRARYVVPGGCMVPTASQGLGEKSRWCSLIASSKTSTTGHRLRHEVIAMGLPGLEVFGRGLDGASGAREVGDKGEALSPYRFSVVVENARVDGYFSEKLVDAFRCGTVPVYWGPRDVVEHFDPRGILFFDGAEDLRAVLAGATEEFYERARPAVEANFEAAAGWRVVEDRMAPLLRMLMTS